jgi:hypothetical protein
VNKQVLIALLGVAVFACGGGGSSSGGGGGGGSSSSGGGGGSASAPAGTTHCPQSGDVTKISDKDTQGEWGYQQKQGATAGDIEVYAAGSGDCEGMPDIRKGSVKILASAVITYKDAASATAAFNGGVFGVGKSQVPSATTGSATGFGATSFYSYSSTESMAGWVNGTKVAAVIAENASESDFKTVANAAKGQTG